jgi:hypothetical protein
MGDKAMTTAAASDVVVTPPDATAPPPPPAEGATIVTKEPSREEMFTPAVDVKSTVDAMEKESPDAFKSLATYSENNLSELPGINALGKSDAEMPGEDKTEDKAGEDTDAAADDADKGDDADTDAADESDDKPDDDAKKDEDADKPKPDEKPADDEKLSKAMEAVSKERAALSSRQVRLRHKELAIKTSEKEIETARTELAERAATLDAREKEIAATVPTSLPTDGLAAVAELASRTGQNPRTLFRGLIERLSKGEGFPSVEAIKTRKESPASDEASEAAKTLRAELDAIKAEIKTEREAKEQADKKARETAEVRAWETEGIDAVKADPEEYELLSKELKLGGEEAIRAEMVKAANEFIRRTGVAPDQGDVLGYLEQVRVEKLEAWTGKPRASGDAPVSDNDETAPAAEKTSEAQQTPPPKAPRTTTNRDASEQRTVAPEKMTERERIAYAAEAVPKDFKGWAHV